MNKGILGSVGSAATPRQFAGDSLRSVISILRERSYEIQATANRLQSDLLGEGQPSAEGVGPASAGLIYELTDDIESISVRIQSAIDALHNIDRELAIPGRVEAAQSVIHKR